MSYCEVSLAGSNLNLDDRQLLQNMQTVRYDVEPEKAIEYRKRFSPALQALPIRDARVQ